MMLARFVPLVLSLLAVSSSLVMTNPLFTTTATQPVPNNVSDSSVVNITSVHFTHTNDVEYGEKDDQGRNDKDFTRTIPSTTTTASATIPPLAKCRFQLQKNVRNELFSVDNRNLRLLMRRFEIDDSEDRCYLTREDLESALDNTSSSTVIVAFTFGCFNPSGTDVVVLENEEAEQLNADSSQTATNRSSFSVQDSGDQTQSNVSSSYRMYNHVISYFQTSRCRINLKAVDIVANMSDLRVLGVHGDRAWDLGVLVTQPQLCRAFRNIVAVSILSDWSTPNYLHHLALCAEHLDNMVEMVLTNDSLTSFPEVLKPAVPNLRALEMNTNYLTSPVDFPWPSGFAKLPRNLTRTYQFNIHYNFGGSFDMQPNLFRRVFMLNANRITNLTHFQFHSDFQFISLQRNGLREIAEDVFDHVPDLQYLNLANNDLKVLPKDLFAKLTKLKRLDLQGNKLKTLPTDIFRNLRPLQRLNVEQNQLQVLQEGLFTSLEELTKLELKNNSITEVFDKAFTTLSVKLKYLDLQNNPLKSFPVVVLLLRGLTSIHLESTDIEVLDFVEIDRRTTVSVLSEALKNPTTGEYVDINTNPTFQKHVFLTNSKLRSMVLYNATRETKTLFVLIIKHFTFHMEGANLACDCHILNVTHQLKELKAEKLMSGQEACFSGWTCAWPSELTAKTVAQLEDEDTYCPLVEEGTLSCPDGCTCYMRTRVNTVIVDCQHGGLSALPSTVPPNTRELWLQNNTIKVLDSKPYLSHLQSLRLSSNNVQELPIDVLRQMPRLTELHVDDNWLTGLQQDFEALRQLRDVRLAGNPFRCDCTTRWMKEWLLSHQMETADWNAIKCTTEDDDGQVFVSVPDQHFVCKVSASLGQLAVPVAIPVSFAFLLLTLGVMAFIQRRRLKVLLYIHTGYHPFDRDPPDDKAVYDVSVCCDVNARAWVLRHMIETLEDGGRYKVFFYCRDAYLGFTTSENVRHCVQKSRRMVVVLSKGWQQNDVLLTATREALARCRKDMPHFLTVVVHQFSAKDIDNKDLQQYVQRGRYITTEDKHFIKKFLYEMPHTKATKAADVEKGRRLQEPEPITLYDIVEAAEKEQNVFVVNQDLKKNRGDAGFMRQVSENEVDVDLRLGQPDDPDIFTLPRQDSHQPSVGDGENPCNQNGDEKNAGNPPASNHHARVAEDRRNMNEQGMDGDFANNPVLQHQVSVDSTVGMPGRTVFVWYADEDLAYTLKNVAVPLEKRDHKCILQDRDFPLGAAIQENIVHAAESSTRCVFVLSDRTADNDWFNFAFHVAFDRHLQSRDHRVALITRQDVDVSKFVDEVQQVLNTSSVLAEDDPWFWKRLKTFMTFDKTELC